MIKYILPEELRNRIVQGGTMVFLWRGNRIAFGVYWNGDRNKRNQME